MHPPRRPRAGLYARARYTRGLRAYRRRLRTPLLLVVGPMLAAFLGIAMFRPLEGWSLAAGAVAATATAFFVFVRDDPPQHVANWGRGADGERMTEKVLRRLEREGWTVSHDVQRNGRANLDHVLTGPAGVFLLETKNLTGTISVEDGVLVSRQFDDPDEIYVHRKLAPRLRGQAAELSVCLGADTGRCAWVNAVVVLWGHFPQGYVKAEKVTYIRGDRLVTWINSRKP